MNLMAIDPSPRPQTTAPTRSFAHSAYSAAAQIILEAARLGPGFVLLSGAAGTGKTTLVHDLAGQLEHGGYCVGRVANSRVDAEDLLRLASFAFGLKADAFPKERLLSALAERLSSRCPVGKPAVLIIDEAQDLAPGALPELCELVALPGGKVPPIQVWLAGRDRIWELLDRPDHAHVRQRILASGRLYPLSLEETRSYIAHSLEQSGWQGDPAISGDALRSVHARTGGVPRLITLTLGHLLLHGRRFGARVLESQDVETVLEHLGKDHPELLDGRPGSATTADRPSGPLSTTPEVRQLSARGKPHPSLGQRPSSTPNDLPGEPTQAMPQLQAGWRWRWVLPGLAAVAVVVYWLSLDEVGDRQGPSDPLPVSELDRAEVPAPAAVGSIELPLAERSQTPVDPPALGSAAPDGGTHTPAEGAEPEASVLSSVEADPTMGPPEDSGAAPDEPLNGVPVGMAERPPGDGQSEPPLGLQETGEEAQPSQAPEVDRLLEQAESALSRNRLMAPAGDNAYGYYRQVLAVDPANEQAKSGMQRIVTRYRELAQQSLKKGNRAEARRYAARGLKLAPKDPQLLAVQRQSAKPRARPGSGETPRAAESQGGSPNVLDQIGDWLGSGRTDSSHFLDH